MNGTPIIAMIVMIHNVPWLDASFSNVSDGPVPVEYTRFGNVDAPNNATKHTMFRQDEMNACPNCFR